MSKDLLKEVPVDQIGVNPHQPRRMFDPQELQNLAGSIRSVGLIHPPLVRFLKEGCYELISGERRFRASKLANLPTIPVVIRYANEEHSAQSALIENVQRVDLNPIEIAKALKSLEKEYGLSQEELAERIGKKRSTIANYMRLLTLPRGIQDSVLSNGITMGHAKSILSLKGFEKQQLLHEIILRDDLSVREAESAAIRIGEKAKKQSLPYVQRDFHLDQLAEKIQEALGTKVVIQGKGKKGSIRIDYYGLDDLDRLLNLFGVD